MCSLLYLHNILVIVVKIHNAFWDALAGMSGAIDSQYGGISALKLLPQLHIFEVED